MAKFSFRLDPVLHFRERKEDEQQIVFAAAMAKLHEAERLCDDYLQRRIAMRNRILNAHHEMDSDELRATYAHCDYLDRAIRTQQGVIEDCRYAAEVERANLLVLTKDKKILETLKERRHEIYVAEAATAEQNENDEINARRFDRATTSRGNSA